MSVSKSIIALASIASSVHGFVQPTHFAASSSRRSDLSAMPLPNLDLDTIATSSVSLSLDDGFIGELNPEANSLVSGLSSVATFVGGVVIFFAVLTVIVSTFIIPAAAKELEKEARGTYPELWREYSAKLEPGEDFSMRPDLIQEMGTKLQQLKLQDFEREGASASSESTPTTSVSSESSSDKSDVIDVEVTKD